MSELPDRPGGAACSDFGAGAGILNDSALPSPRLVVCLDDLLWCNVDEDFSVTIRDWFGSCGGWTLLLRLLVCLFLVWFVNMDVTIICIRANRIFLRSLGSFLVYLVSPPGAFLLPYSAVFCTTQALPTLPFLFTFSWLYLGSCAHMK